MIDLDTLREMLAGAERMVPYYSADLAKKTDQDAAMTAAGLEPVHGKHVVAYAAENVARSTREANVLRYLIAYHSGEVFAGEVAA